MKFHMLKEVGLELGMVKGLIGIQFNEKFNFYIYTVDV